MYICYTSFVNACDLHYGIHVSLMYLMHTYALTRKPNSIAGNGVHVQYYWVRFFERWLDLTHWLS